MARPAKVVEPVVIAEPLPVKITMSQRVCYEIGTSGVLRDLHAGQIVTDPQTIAEVIHFGAQWY